MLNRHRVKALPRELDAFFLSFQATAEKTLSVCVLPSAIFSRLDCHHFATSLGQWRRDAFCRRWVRHWLFTSARKPFKCLQNTVSRCPNDRKKAEIRQKGLDYVRLYSVFYSALGREYGDWLNLWGNLCRRGGWVPWPPSGEIHGSMA